MISYMLCRDVTAFAWGDDIVFTDATIVANKPEAAGLSIVTVNVGTDISSGYDKPGQFIQMKVSSLGAFGTMSCRMGCTSCHIRRHAVVLISHCQTTDHAIKRLYVQP